MNVVGPGDLRVGSIGLERFEYDLEFEVALLNEDLRYRRGGNLLRFTA